jgi:myo-inositol-1(or 4)-monophosphatase
MDYSKELNFARDTAHAAGEIMKKYYRADQHIEIKGDMSPVTVADKEINHLLIERVRQEFPEYGVLGEEESDHSDRTTLWVCDPIDGTVPYILHVPTSVFSLALVVDGKPLVAVVYNPWIGELYTATKHGGAYRNDERISVSGKSWGPGVHIGTAASIEDGMIPIEKAKELLGQQIYVNSVLGLVYACCTVADGVIEGRVFNYHTPHDIAAVKLIVEEAGGKVTDIKGNEQRYDRKINGAIVSNGLVHDQLIKLVQQ